MRRGTKAGLLYTLSIFKIRNELPDPEVVKMENKKKEWILFEPEYIP
jgi:hypothetical protein